MKPPYKADQVEFINHPQKAKQGHYIEHSKILDYIPNRLGFDSVYAQTRLNQ